MKAIILENPGDPKKLKLTEIEKPPIKEGEVLVEVKSVSINPIDVKTRSGKGAYSKLKDENPLILGWDISGIVVETNSSKFKLNDEVFGMINFPGHGKAYAQFVTASENHIALKPKNISSEEAAATSLAALTALQAIEKAELKEGQNVLIHAAAGGVGHFAVQIAKYLGASVTGTSSAKNREFVLSVGADNHINYTNYDWENSEEKFDFILDTIGGENIDHSVKVLKNGGTIISIPSGLNEKVEEKATSVNAKGFTMLVQSNGNDMQKLAELLEKSFIKPHIYKIYHFDEMSEAHKELEKGRAVGKIVVNF
ncbi:NADP-dependent oxidoreductase [Chryseobacterium sp. Ch-15]|uniref:NADP-dependent oxidoreductase n=1 Tax=Chryseobacterium muglaense TaxID=2893752 RepID=A0A9Q3UT69_9FLAO|nr:NADP-dependent oxidoreductase [Chryseobacterium muglaense]MBD3904162.1 NADP-dependent oxidoreductase [Chryseobacterium muglaense]MCC9033266.1 NADP-dependent oxidoreductase [Chryseobacterium muglaense]MCM2553761.1 NADP-dependent oxidoreductase [Chryseobacterium muglaense]